MNLPDLQPADRKRLPGYPVPAVRIGRLAVSRDEQGNGYGRLLLGHAVNCSMQLRHRLGVRVLLADACTTAPPRFIAVTASVPPPPDIRAPCICRWAWASEKPPPQPSHASRGGSRFVCFYPPLSVDWLIRPGKACACDQAADED